MSSYILAQGDADAAAGVAIFAGAIALVFALISLLFTVLMFASWWKIFTKAGKPGWAAIIPIYNTFVLVEIVGKPIMWFILTLVPCVNIVVLVILLIDLAKSFGKGPGFAIGMLLLAPIFVPLLGFGDSRYLGPQG